MISIRLTPAMQVVLHGAPGLLADRVRRSDGFRANPRTGAEDAFVCSAAVLEDMRVVFLDLASDSVLPKKDAAIARHAAKRCGDALARARDRATRIPVSITVAEQEALRDIDRDPPFRIPNDVADRLLRRELVTNVVGVGWEVSPRGRAVLAGTPPGDLVPMAWFAKGARVRLAFTVEPSEDADRFVAERLRVGSELVITDVVDDRLQLSTAEWVAVERAHPRIFYVLGGPAL